MKMRVLMIHGIYSDGSWMEQVADVLKPHFDCRPISYDEYRDWKAIRIIYGVDSKKKALRKVREGYEAATDGYPGRVHLIAHSFGTVLSASLLKKHAWIHFGKIIYVGSALPHSFPWQQILNEDPEKFHQLRNEIGQKDIVASLAGLLQLLRPGLGNAGFQGFRDAHRVTGPLLDCSLCPPEGEPESLSRIHDVPLGGYGHSDTFLSHRHALVLWLPWLWGFSPIEYRDFLNLCEKARRLQEEGALVEAELAMEDLGRWRWHWAEISSETISYSEYVALSLSCYLKKFAVTLPVEELDELRALALQGVCEGVVTAFNERRKVKGERNEERILALHPRQATARAVKELGDLVVRNYEPA